MMLQEPVPGVPGQCGRGPGAGAGQTRPQQAEAGRGQAGSQHVRAGNCLRLIVTIVRLNM